MGENIMSQRRSITLRITLYIGHTYCTAAADALKRFKTLQGCEAYMVTGSDEHGQKIKEKAAKWPWAPWNTWTRLSTIPRPTLDIDYDVFVRSTDPVHEKNVQEIFTALYEKGEIYAKGEYEGYCTPLRVLRTESQLLEGHLPPIAAGTPRSKRRSPTSSACPSTGTGSSNTSRRPAGLYPAGLQEDRDGQQALRTWSVTRSNLDWGVKVPFDQDHVVYVRIDAPSYI